MPQPAQAEETVVTGKIEITPSQPTVNGTPINGHAHHDVAPANRTPAEEKAARIAEQEKKHPRKLIASSELTVPFRASNPVGSFDQAKSDAFAAQRGAEARAISARASSERERLARDRPMYIRSDGSHVRDPG